MPTSADTALDLTLHPAFKLLKHDKIPSLSLDVLVSEHTATGLIHYHLAHPSDENAFMIGFRTQPMTDRGEAHILEHTSLCGSVKYPVRDPFFSMVKRSLNTFMNAFTASDWTAYPFATQNRQDYFNLLSVYLDATFFPNLNPLDFAQEGIRVELDDNGKPQYKGIVFNEMKGAMSGEIDQLYHTLARHLFPTTTYHYNSGGEPSAITELTHADLVKFHQSHYHPSNAVVMSFGNIPVAQTQARLHEDALAVADKVFGKGKKHASRLEQSLPQPISVTETYQVDSVKPKQTHHVMAWLLPSILDARQRLALRFLEGVLVEHAGSPLRAYLDSHPLASAPTPLLGLDDSHYQMVFYAGVRGSEAQHAQAIEDGILAVLRQVAEQPLDPIETETILHQIEIDQRHIGGDSMPYGLNLMLEGFSTAIHDGDPMAVWDIDADLNWLRTSVEDPNFVKQLIETHLLNNPHRVRLTLVPDANKSEQLAKDEQAKLDEIANTLTDETRQSLVKNAKILAERQATLDDVDLLPKVGLADIPADIQFKTGSKQAVTLSGNDSVMYEYEAGTNGLYYYQVILPLDGHEAIIQHPDLSTYLTLISEVGTKDVDARSFQALQARHSSGVTVRISQRTSPNDPEKMDSFLVVATRSLSRKLEAIDLLKQVLNDTVFSEFERIEELLTQKQLGWQSRLANSGHAYAMQTAGRNMSQIARLEYVRGGLPALNDLTEFLAKAETDKGQWQALSERLTALHNTIKALPKQALIIAESEHLPTLKQAIVDSWADAVTAPTDVLPNFAISTDSSDIAWLAQTNVFHNAMAFQAVPADHADAPALMVLSGVLRNNYLHRTIRETGGAYGGGASFDSNACAFKFYSYRDPRFEATFADFLASVDWLLEQKQSEKTDAWLEEAILGLMAGMDKPASPAGEAVKALFAELHGRGKEWQQTMRAKILAVTLADLQRVAMTYLKDKPFTRATLAPYDKAEVVEKVGFMVERVI
ncbi:MULTISPECIES: insulinase family protein [unclassified Moraxella]|uniref:insulinase family protein n=1 Tax=unclassified Moraxella TaxID=2685852 RepID=UPI003AF7B9EE